MSEIVIFIIGSLVFAITVYGVVMAGGMALSRVEIEQNPHLGDDVDDEELQKRFPTHLEY